MPNSWRLKGSSPEHSNTHAPQHRVAGLSQFFGLSSSPLDMWDMKAGIQFSTFWIPACAGMTDPSS